MCKTLINRAKTICEVSNINDELEHLRNVLKMNDYPRHFIDNAMKTPQSIQQKIEYKSSVCLPYIGPASHKVERILRNEAGIKVYHSSENKLFRALCTHKDNVNESQKPGVCRIPCECGLVYVCEAGRGLSVRLGEHRTSCDGAERDGSAVDKHAWTCDHRMGWDGAIILEIECREFSRGMGESVGIERHNAVDREGGPLDGAWRALFNVQN